MPTPDVYLKVANAEKFKATAKALQDAGDKKLKLELYRALNRAAQPLRDAAPGAARQGIGNKHGFGEQVAAEMKVTVTKSPKGGNPRVTIRARRGKSPLSRLNAGQLRHPTFGRWKSADGKSLARVTRIEAGWWEKALEEHAPDARQEIAKVLKDIRSKLV